MFINIDIKAYSTIKIMVYFDNSIKNLKLLILSFGLMIE